MVRIIIFLNDNDVLSLDFKNYEKFLLWLDDTFEDRFFKINNIYYPVYSIKRIEKC
jgi:hypothetical protein